MAKTNVLGTEYEVTLEDMNNTLLLDKDGYCQTYDKQIVIRKPEYLLQDGSEKGKKMRFQETLLHELVHAFCKESVVFYDDNEDLVEWIAEMIPKMIRSYSEIVNQFEDEYE